MKRFENQDYGLIRSIRSVWASPDGKHVLYPVQTMDTNKDEYQTDLWIADPLTGKETRLTQGGRAGNAFWLDESRVVFSSVRGDAAPNKETVYYVIDIHGGEAGEFLRIPKPGAQISPLSENKYLVRGETDINEEGKGAKEKWMHFDEYPYLCDGGGYVNKVRRSLFLWDEDTRELKQLTESRMQTMMPYFSNDVLTAEDGFYFAGYSYDKDAQGKACICKYIWETGQTVELCQDSCYVFSMARRDGRIYYGAWAIEEGPAIASVRIKSVSEQGGDLRVEAEPDWELGSVREWKGSFTFTRNSRARSYAAVWGQGLTYQDIDLGNVNPAAIAPAGERLYVAGWEKDRPNEVYCYENGIVKRLSHQNDKLFEQCTFSENEPLSVWDRDKEICGWVMKPVGYEPGKKYPGILNIHGGPHGNFNSAFCQEHQRWANEGYFVFFCNPVGSTSYGTEFMDVTGDLGGQDYENIMAFTDAVLKAYPDLDGERLAVCGQSYGGYMTNWIIGQTDRFKAAVPRMSISNWISMHGTSVERWYGDFVIASTPWEKPELAWKQSPLKYAKNVKTPTLFIQHEKDQCCPMEQAQQMFVAILENGVPAGMVVNLGCGHGGRRVSQLLHDIDVMMEWFGKYV